MIDNTEAKIFSVYPLFIKYRSVVMVFGNTMYYVLGTNFPWDNYLKNLEVGSIF